LDNTPAALLDLLGKLMNLRAQNLPAASMQNPAEASRMVAMATQDAEQAAERALNTALDFLPRVAKGMQRSSDLIKQGRVNEAMSLFSETCDGLGWFFGLMSGLDWLRPPVEGRKTWDQEASAFRDYLARMETAIAQEDWVVVSDALSFEWAPRILVWSEHLPLDLASLRAIYNPRAA
jgi:hypothetical protein